ncbi:DUF3575 domain-containing protein [Porphyromonadaceae bacterium W3.11]|nr:DUF3575 domain-containing protein [Porphyromonadaceae bacterium W3.11]
MKKKIYIFSLLLGMLSFISVQNAEAQKVAAKTNLAYWGVFGSPNLGIEFAMGDKFTLDLNGGMNMWKFSDNKKAKHWLVQPEVRYWFCDVFNGHFIGLHGHGGEFNIGNWNIPVGRLKTFKDNRYEGYFYGAGLSYGYQWVLSPRWNLELSLGGGWARIHYRQFDCAECGAFKNEGNYDYFGITRTTLSLVYFIK